MNHATAQFAVHTIADRVGISVTAKILRDGNGEYCEIIPDDAHPNEGFSVQLRLGWRSAEAVFLAGKYAAPLIDALGKASEEGKQIFAAFVAALKYRKTRINLRVNGVELNSDQPATWPTNWTRIEFSLRHSPVIIEEANDAQLERLILDLVIPVFGMIAALIGVEENEPVTAGETEGRAIQSLTTRYERKKVNREACIQLKGTRCTACGFDFAEHYGALGVGYIEVHHTKSVASIDADYRINIMTDLEPLCANCHAMAHREEPPVAVERLKKLVTDRQEARGK